MRTSILVTAMLVLTGITPWAAAQAADEPVVKGETTAAELTQERVAEERVNPHCLRETGTRIASRSAAGAARTSGLPRNCVAGRAYDRDDLDRTGEMSLGDALRKLDPSVSIRRY